MKNLGSKRFSNNKNKVNIARKNDINYARNIYEQHYIRTYTPTFYDFRNHVTKQCLMSLILFYM